MLAPSGEVNLHCIRYILMIRESDVAVHIKGSSDGASKTQSDGEEKTHHLGHRNLTREMFGGVPFLLLCSVAFLVWKRSWCGGRGNLPGPPKVPILGSVPFLPKELRPTGGIHFPKVY